LFRDNRIKKIEVLTKEINHLKKMRDSKVKIKDIEKPKRKTISIEEAKNPSIATEITNVSGDLADFQEEEKIIEGDLAIQSDQKRIDLPAEQ